MELVKTPMVKKITEPVAAVKLTQLSWQFGGARKNRLLARKLILQNMNIHKTMEKGTRRAALPLQNKALPGSHNSSNRLPVQKQWEQKVLLLKREHAQQCIAHCSQNMNIRAISKLVSRTSELRRRAARPGTGSSRAWSGSSSTRGTSSRAPGRSSRSGPVGFRSRPGSCSTSGPERSGMRPGGSTWARDASSPPRLVESMRALRG